MSESRSAMARSRAGIGKSGGSSAVGPEDLYDIFGFLYTKSQVHVHVTCTEPVSECGGGGLI